LGAEVARCGWIFSQEGEEGVGGWGGWQEEEEACEGGAAAGQGKRAVPA